MKILNVLVPRSNITAEYCSLHLLYTGPGLHPPLLSLLYVFIEIGKYFLEFPTYFLADGFLIKLKIFPAVGFSLCIICIEKTDFISLLSKTARGRTYCNSNGNEKNKANLITINFLIL